MGHRRESFDYVIVGGGSAGCALAARLSEDPNQQVLLLEAGPPDQRREIHIPAGFPSLFKTAIDWAFHTEPEPELGGRRLYWPRGKVLGGCSSINAMLYIRGHRRDYDGWRELGNRGWGFADVLPYFRGGENQARGASEWHGTGGPLEVCDPLHPNPLSHAFVAAGQELGFPLNEDFNGSEQEGVGLYQVTQKAGRRSSAAVAYLRPARRRRNLKVQTHASVRRVLFDGTRAVGIEFQDRRGEHRVEAKREVILSAGAIGSPQLLMLSGVGPADALREQGLPVVLDAPGVGGHLQDHPVVSVICRSHLAKTLDSAETLGNFLRYLLLRKGPFTSSVCEAGAFVHSGVEPAERDPDLQFHFVPAALRNHGFDQATDQGFNFGVTLIRPRSLGSLTLRSANPADPPCIHAGYLSAPRDLAALVEGVKIARRLAHTRAFQPYFDHEVVPGSAIESEAALANFVRQTLETLYHPVGTCRMGPVPQRGDEHPAVVDGELRVHGLEGLRVVDASVMPWIPAGNTNAPTLMIAEKAAAFLRRDAASTTASAGA